MNHQDFQRFFKRIASLFLVPVLLGSAALSALFVLPTQAASAPNITSYQGRLLNANGVPIATASASMVFEFYDSLAAGTCLYSNSSSTCASATARTVTLTDGLFSENIGDTTVGVPYAAIPDSVFGGNAGVYLQITVNGEVLTPRKQFVAAPYAMNADTLDGLDSSSFTSLFTDGGATTYLTDALDDFAIGGTLPTASPFGVDESANTVYVGEGSNFNGTIFMKASDANSGQFELTTSDQFYFSGADIVVEAGRGIDTQSAGAFLLGNVNATSVSICNSAACDTLSLGTNADADTITIGDSLDTTSITSANWSIATSGLITSANDLALNGGDLTSTSGTFNLLDAVGNSTNIEIGGVSTDLANSINIATDSTSADSIVIGSINAASTAQIRGATTTLNGTTELNLNDASGTKTTDIGGVDNDGADTVRIATQGTSADAVTIGNSNALTTVAITGGDDWSITTAGVATFSSLTSSLNCTDCIDASDLADTLSLDGLGMDISIGAAQTYSISSSSTDNVQVFLNSTGDFEVVDSGTSAFKIDDSGDATFQSGSPSLFITNTVGTDFSIDASGTTLSMSSVSDALTPFVMTNLGGFSIGDVASAKTINIGGVAANGSDTVNIATNGTSSDAVTIGNSQGSTTVEIVGGDDWNITSTGAASFLSVDKATAGALAIGNTVATSVSICSSAACDTLDLAQGTDADSINLATDATSGDSINMGNSNAATTFDITGGSRIQLDSAGTVYVNDGAGTRSVNIGGVLSDGATTVAIATNATSADAISIGNTHASTTLSLSGVVSMNVSGSDATNIGTGSYSGTVTIGNNTTGTVVIASNGGLNVDSTGNITESTNITSRGFITLAPTGAVTTAIVATDTDYTNALSIGDNNIIGTTGAIDFTNFDVASTGVTSVNLNATASTNGMCHSGADVDVATDTERDLVPCSAAPDDYAEWYETEAGVSFGDVVATSGSSFTYNAKQSDPFTGMLLPGTISKTLPIMKKAVASDTVFGIVSTSPNQVIGSDVKNQGAHPMPIALVGRVPLHVSSEGGPIHVGDYLVPSSTPGYAMKATDAGRVIARALADFSGTGMTTILVFVDNGWYGGEMFAADGSSTITGGITISALANASASAPTANSNALMLNGSAWNGASAETVSMGLRTKVSSLGDYRLSIEDGTGGEVAAFSNAGDLFVAGKLFPSDRGSAQSTAYIFYDSTAGPGYMKTNAAGWNVGSYDFAEMFPSSDSLVAGDVVVFGGAAQSVAKSSSTTYDKSIAGVVSTRPGFLAGEYVSGSYPIALSGRVPTKVSAENGAVAIGDPLTSSSKPGYAMKATKAGPILGYAMEPLAEGEGKIVAFIRASYYAGTGTNASPDANTSISQLPSSSLSNLDVTGSLNMNAGSILSIGSLEGVGGNWKINENGDFVTNGVITERVRSYQNELVDTFATTSREKIVQLSGTAMLQLGQSEVSFESIDPKFNDIISNVASYRVIVTPAGVTGQVYVTDKTNTGFYIHDSANTDSVAVDWLVIAYQKDYEPVVISAPVPAPEPEPLPVVDVNPVVTEVIADNGPVVAPDPTVTEITSDPSVATPTVESTVIIPTAEPTPEVAGTTDPAPVVTTPVDESITPAAEPVIIDPASTGDASIAPTAP